MSRIAWILLIAALSCSCVQRTMTVTSDPPSALVYMNNQEIGRTPLTRDFTWYGTYDVQLRKDGYETLNTKTAIIAPLWQWPPFDLLAELWPWAKDHRHLSYTLKPATTQPADLTDIGQDAEDDSEYQKAHGVGDRHLTGIGGGGGGDGHVAKDERQANGDDPKGYR